MEINPLIKEGAVPFDLIESNLPKTETEILWLSLINPIQKHVDTIIIAFFIGWTALFCVYMDGPSLVELSYLPFIGIFAACLANAVPIGGGIGIIIHIIIIILIINHHNHYSHHSHHYHCGSLYSSISIIRIKYES